jgi:hypothetical protein
MWLKISKYAAPLLIVANIFLYSRSKLKIYALNTKIENTGAASLGLGTAVQFKFTVFVTR